MVSTNVHKYVLLHIRFPQIFFCIAELGPNSFLWRTYDRVVYTISWAFFFSKHLLFCRILCATMHFQFKRPKSCLFLSLYPLGLSVSLCLCLWMSQTNTLTEKETDRQIDKGAKGQSDRQTDFLCVFELLERKRVG